MKTFVKIENSNAAFKILLTRHNDSAEEFWGLFVNHQLELISADLIHRGTLNYCKIHPRDLFRLALKNNAFAIIIAHNHVSANTEPSECDIKLTKRLIKISKLIEIPIIDHIVFNSSKFYSFKEHHLI